MCIILDKDLCALDFLLRSKRLTQALFVGLSFLGKFPLPNFVYTLNCLLVDLKVQSD